MATRVSRTPFVGGNWKMNLTRAGVADLTRATARAAASRGVDCVVFPPFVYLSDAIAASADLRVGAQDCSAEPQGAFTGQVSAAMLRDIGCTHVLIGHSERRHGLCETDAMLSKKLARALEAGLVPVLCVGETLSERECGEADRIIESQLCGSLSGHSENALADLVVAYEPVWAIGTGRTATPADAAAAHATARRTLGRLYSGRFAERTRIIYGGSVNARNAAELLTSEEIDGGLVGGASLVAADFAAIIEAAARR
jgi:triosephosphate isomerase (TIM)